MFIDQAIIVARSGTGGNGCVSFRREKYVPRGGPDGGNGGNGGSVVVLADKALSTLLDFQYHPHYYSKNGDNGKGKNMFGRDAEDLIIKVPCGTVIYENETNKKIIDLVTHGQSIIVCKGGRGGFGNSVFATSTNQAPRLAENGEPGEEKKLRLELKLIADVGLIGYPNVGKSTLISRISDAHPKIANYHFTTLTPNLGVVKKDNWRPFVVADIPGLIEGAHDGVGLGIKFLRHIERTRLLVHILDMSGLEGRNPFDDFEIIINELKLYSEKLVNKKQILVANKMDLPTARENFKKLEKKFTKLGLTILPISGVTGEGLDDLLKCIIRTLDQIQPEEEPEEEEIIVEFKPRFTINKENDIFVLRGDEVEKWSAMTDFQNEEAIERLCKILQKMGIEEALLKMKIKPEDMIKVKNIEFSYSEIFQ